MKNSTCYLCGGEQFEKVEGKVRDIPTMTIYRCAQCGLVFLESFDHIDASYYEDSKMREHDQVSDWRGHLRECERDDARRAQWIKPLIVNKSVLDFGCGAGGFLAHIRDCTLRCVGVEKDRYFRGHLKREWGLTVYAEVSEINESYDVITLFHVLEHLKDPKVVLKQLAHLLNPGGFIVIEVPNADDVLLSLYRCTPFTEFTYWGPHLYLFNNSTLRRLLEDSGLTINFIQQIQRYPLSNHLYWLSRGKPGGHRAWSFIDTPELQSAYEHQLSKLGLCDTIIASVSHERIY